MGKNAGENHILPFLWMRGEEESVIRTEIEKIYECGIRAVCVEARPHQDFCGPGWWHDMDIVIDEAKRRDMKIWILDDKHFPTGYANGLIEKKYPERKKLYINYSTADVFGASHRLTLNVKRMLQPTVKFWEIGKPFNKEERDRNEFYAMLAVKFHHGNVMTEEVIDLSDTFDGEYAEFQLPAGQWKVFVIYKTRTDGGDESYINLIDKVSAHTQIEGVYEEHYRHYPELFGNVIAGFFSDEPQFGNLPGFDKDAVIGKKQMPLPWSGELEDMLTEKYGEALKKVLPYLWTDSERMQSCPQIRYDYMDGVSRLYEQNFSRAIGTWCEEHGVEYIGHVVEDDGTHSRLGMGAAHYFRAMSGQHMAGIDCIGGQIVYGAPDALRTDMVPIDGEFYHYLIGKLGASCGHLDPRKKGRIMCELFGAYGWRFGVRDMKYLLDHLLVKGINYLVPHAFSMGEYPDMDCPPHFYARGNNPQFPYFAEMMKYANRMCRLLSGGTHIATAAVLYDAEAEWCGERMAMQKVGRELLEHQIDFDVVSTDMLCEKVAEYHTRIENNRLKIHKETFEVLIIPYTQRITEALAGFLEKNSGLPVIFVDGLPEQTVQGCRVVPLNELAETLQREGKYEIRLREPYPYLSVYHYVTDKNLFMLLNESAEETFCGEIELPAVDKAAAREWYIGYGMDGQYERLTVHATENNRLVVKLQLYPGESCVIIEGERPSEAERTSEGGHTSEGECTSEGRHTSEAAVYQPMNERLSSCTNRLVLSEDWKYSTVRAIDYPEFGPFEEMKKLCPVSELAPSFAGVICYEKSFELAESFERAYIQFEHVYEVMRLTVNGTEAGICIRPPYQMEIGSLLKKGTNEIRLEVATTPARDQLNYPEPPFVMSHVPMEPTGMFGEVVLSSCGKLC